MSKALKVKDLALDAVNLEVQGIVEAAILRALEVNLMTSVSILDQLSNDDWQSMDERSSNICVEDSDVDERVAA